MPIHRDPATLVDIALACEDILAFTRGMTWHDFAADVKTHAAVNYKLTVIGEAVKRLSPEFKAGHRMIPWRQISDARNILIHQYDHVKLAEVWKMASEDVPELLDYLRPLLPNEHE